MPKQDSEKYSSKTLTTQALLCLAIVLLVCLVGVEVIRQYRQPSAYAEKRVKPRRPLPTLERHPQTAYVKAERAPYEPRFAEETQRYALSIQNAENELLEAQKKINLMDLTIDTLAKRLEIQREEKEKNEQLLQEELRQLRITAFEEQERLTKALQDNEKERASLKFSLNQKLQALSNFESEVSQQSTLLDLQVIEIKDLIAELKRQKNSLGLESSHLKEKLEREQARVKELESQLQELSAQAHASKDALVEQEGLETKLACKELELGAVLASLEEAKSDYSTQIQDLAFILNWEKTSSQSLHQQLQQLMSHYQESQTRVDQLQAKLDEMALRATEMETHLLKQEGIATSKQAELKDLLDRFEESTQQIQQLSYAIELEAMKTEVAEDKLAEEEMKTKQLASVLNEIVDKTLSLEKELLAERQRFSEQEREFDLRERELTLSLKAEQMRSQEVTDALQSAFVELSQEKNRALEIEQDLYTKQNDLATLQTELQAQKALFETRQNEYQELQQEIRARLQNEQMSNEDLTEKLYISYSQNEVDQQKISALETELEQVHTNQEKMRQNFLAERKVAQETADELLGQLGKEREQLQASNALCAESERKIYELETQMVHMQESINALQADLFAKQTLLTEKERELERAANDLSLLVAEESTRIQEMTEGINTAYRKFTDEQKHTQELEGKLDLAYQRASDLEQDLTTLRRDLIEKEREMSFLTHQLNDSLSEEYTRAQNATHDLQKTMDTLVAEQQKGLELTEQLSVLEVELEVQKNLMAAKQREFEQASYQLELALAHESQAKESHRAELEAEKVKVETLQWELAQAAETYQSEKQKVEMLQYELSRASEDMRSFEDREVEVSQRMEDLSDLLLSEQQKNQETTAELKMVCESYFADKQRIQQLDQELYQTKHHIADQENALQALRDSASSQEKALSRKIKGEQTRVQKLAKVLRSVLKKHDTLETKQQELESLLQQSLVKEKQLADQLEQEKTHLTDLLEQEKMRSYKTGLALKKAVQVKDESERLSSELQAALECSRELEQKLNMQQSAFAEQEQELQSHSEHMKTAYELEKQRSLELSERLQKSLKEHNEEHLRLVKLEEELGQALEKATYFEGELSGLEGFLVDREQEFEAQAAALTSALKSEQERVQNLTASLQKAAHDFELEKGRTEQLEDLLQIVSDQNSTLQTELTQAEGAARTVAKLEELIEELQVKENALKATLAAGQMEKEQFENAYQKEATHVQELAHALSAAEEQMAQLKGEITQQKQGESELFTLLDHHKRQLQEFEGAYQEKYRHSQELEEQLSLSQNQTAQLTQEIENQRLAFAEKETNLKVALETEKIKSNTLNEELIVLREEGDREKNQTLLLEEELLGTVSRSDRLEALLAAEQSQHKAKEAELLAALEEEKLRTASLTDTHQEQKRSQELVEEQLRGALNQVGRLDEALAEQKSLVAYRIQEKQILQHQLDIAKEELEKAQEFQSMYQEVALEYQSEQQHTRQLQQRVAALENAQEEQLTHSKQIEADLKQEKGELQSVQRLLEEKVAQLRNADELQHAYFESQKRSEDLEGRIHQMKQTIGSLKNELEIEHALVQQREEELEQTENEKERALTATESHTQEMEQKLFEMSNRAEDLQNQLAMQRISEERMQQMIEEYATTQEMLMAQMDELKSSLNREKVVTQEITEELQKTLSNFNAEQQNKQELEKKLEEMTSHVVEQEQTTAALEE